MLLKPFALQLLRTIISLNYDWEVLPAVITEAPDQQGQSAGHITFNAVQAAYAPHRQLT